MRNLLSILKDRDSGLTSSKLQVGGGGGRQRLMDDTFNRMPGAPVGPATGVSVKLTG